MLYKVPLPMGTPMSSPRRKTLSFYFERSCTLKPRRISFFGRESFVYRVSLDLSGMMEKLVLALAEFGQDCFL